MTVTLLVVFAVSLFALSFLFALQPVSAPAALVTWDGRTLTPNQIFNRESLRRVVFLWAGLGLPRAVNTAPWDLRTAMRWLRYVALALLAVMSLYFLSCYEPPGKLVMAFAPMMLPPARPEISHNDALELAKPFLLPEDRVFILGRRGYFRDTMGTAGENDIGIYDDAWCLVTPNRCTPYNANTDPSKMHEGVAVLQPGRWLYQLGIHGLNKPKEKQYEALVQAQQVVVRRAQTLGAALGMEEGDVYHPQYGCRLTPLGDLWRGEFGINHHKGSRETTSSEGCQTIHPSQWGDAIEKVKSTMKFYSMRFIPYILTERT